MRERKLRPRGLLMQDWWVGVGGVAAVAGVMIAVAQLLFTQPSLIVVILLAGFLLVTSMFLIAAGVIRRRQPTQVVINIHNDEDERRYYDIYIDAIRNAKEEIYYAGRGFDRLTEKSAHYADVTHKAIEEAVCSNRAYYTRIQTSAEVSEAWCDAVARLLEDYPNRVAIYGDLTDPTFVNIGIYDPNSSSCVVQVAFEAEAHSARGPFYRLIGGFFLFGNVEVARGLQRLFVRRIEGLQSERLTAADVRAIPREGLQR